MIFITLLWVETTPNPEWYKGAQHSTNLPLAKQGQTRIKANSKLPSPFQNLRYFTTCLDSCLALFSQSRAQFLFRQKIANDKKFELNASIGGIPDQTTQTDFFEDPRI